MRFLNTNKKKNLLVFFFAFFVVSVSFVIFPGVVSADHSEVHNNLLNKTGCTGFFDASGGCLMSAAGDIAGVVAAPFIYAFKLILLGIFTLLGWVASVAVTLFEWVIKPENIAGPNGLLNLPSVYQMWQFVRDFFNIFFIFVLLYIAFTTVFQIQKNFKKAILSLVLAALFVNFSYPIARVLIDVTNVPMYFFANQMMASNGKSPGEGGVFSTAMTASHIQGILIPSDIGILTAGKIDFAQYFVAIIYMFLFAVTLLVLAVMFVIRLVALVILVIFSSAGFVAFIVPGMEKYGKMWWDNFWKYALFGPAAMLMLLVATRFFDELDNVNTGIFKGLKDTSSGLVGGDPTLIASMAMFSIPIIMLWFAMGLGQKFSIAGAASISGKGEKFAKWAAKKTYDNPLGRGLGGGIKERAENSKFAKYLTPKYWSGPSGVEAGIKGGIMGAGNDGVRQGWTNARARLAEDQHNKKVTEEEKKMEEARTSETQLRATMVDRSGRYSKAQVEAAARILSKKDKLQNAAHMGEAAAAMQYANAGMNPATAQEKTAELVKKAGGEIYQTGLELATAIGRLGTDTKAISSLIDKAEKDALNTMTLATYRGYSPAIQGKLSGKMKKEGAIRVLVDEQVSRGAARSGAVYTTMASMKPEDASKVFKDATLKAYADAYLTDISTTGTSPNPERYTKIKAEA